MRMQQQVVVAVWMVWLGFGSLAPWAYAGETRSGIDFHLDGGGMITGQVRDFVSAEPIAFASVEIFNHEGEPVTSVSTDITGSYTAVGLLPGSYFAGARVFAGGYFAEIYDDRDCPRDFLHGQDCEPLAGDPIEIQQGLATTGIDFTLERKGVISGRVTEVTTGQPIAGATIEVRYIGGGVAASGSSDATGSYRVESLDPNQYYVIVRAPRHHGEIYDDIPCIDTASLVIDCPVANGEAIDVIRGAEVVGIDFALRLLGAIEGRVTDAGSGQPVAGAQVQILWPAVGIVGVVFTDEQGRYRIETFGGQIYGAYAIANGYEIELWNDIPCPRFNCNSLGGDPIEVTDGQTTPGVDFALDRLGRLSGRVTDAANGAALANALVFLLAPQGSPLTFTRTDDTGRYLFTDLATANYLVWAGAEGPYLGEIYDGVPCFDPRRPVCNPAAAERIHVEVAQTTDGIDFALGPGATITGIVTSEADGQPLSQGSISLWSQDGVFIHEVRTDATGRYTIEGLPADRYFATASSFSPGFAPELYRNLPCHFGCTVTIGTPIDVVLGATRAGIDFDLLPLTGESCGFDEPLLCLNDQRFKVTARWRNFEGDTDRAEAQPLTDDSGYFWFFGPDNVEVVVKVIDACTTAQPRFWVFAAGLTNVEVELEVEDTLTGDVKIYDNALGQPFQPILDTDAFATCGSGLAPASRLLRKPAIEKLFGNCQSDAVGLCLNQGRFRVEAFFETFQGTTGQGQAVELTTDSGYFWFFDDANVEVVVKVLSACGDVNPRFWVFAAGLTNVEVLLRVTDTETGAVREYRNPLATPFRPILDTGAFATCP